ncbi:unnamed protein product [Pseudo-nitzschia multistriata]|uniref:GmrSD restriction endonucleases N-terminal domain-containing protein n=1 Tax=Pseudo-nitzschia multistriata TaxID=183589 RepID=A0A448ZJR2_9STRA|nr:unnamed protein product [Pseudo-nitzschia multistriata]
MPATERMVRRGGVSFQDTADETDGDVRNDNQSSPSEGNNATNRSLTASLPRREPSTSATALSHLQKRWPGKIGNSRHLEVRPMSFDAILSGGSRIVVPMFQRRYCWTHSQIERWWKDVSERRSEEHRTGKTMFKKVQNTAENETTLLCIDGQQRLTTTTIFLMALRAEARKHGKASASASSSALVQAIDAALFVDAEAVQGVKRWAKYHAFHLVRNNSSSSSSSNNNNPGDGAHSFVMPSFPPGWLPPFAPMLTPSYIDRSAYFQLLCTDYVREALEERLAETGQTIELSFDSDCRASIQHTAFAIFAEQLHHFAASIARQTPVLSSLQRLYKKQVGGFSLMYIELLTDDNVQQIFLWMQEKSVFGMGALLLNDSPGVDFTHVDLARNLILSSGMNEPLEAQVRFYNTFWIDTLEKRFGTLGVRSILDRLVRPVLMGKATRHIGDMEQQVEKYKEATPAHMRHSFADNKPMMVYARFHSHVQQRAIEMEDGDPNAITLEVAKSIIEEMVTIGNSMENIKS